MVKTQWHHRSLHWVPPVLFFMYFFFFSFNPIPEKNVQKYKWCQANILSPPKIIELNRGKKRIFSYRATSLPVVRGEQTDSWFVFINKGDFKVDVKGRQNQEIVSYAVLARCASRLSLCRRLFRVCLCRCLLWSMSGSTELLLGVTAMLSPDWTLSAPRLSAAHSSRSLFSSCFADFFEFVLERKGMLLCSVLG